LVDWAFHLTEHLSLDDSEAMRAARSSYASENARRSPFVLKGDTLSAGTFWHGKLLDEWANDWVRYQTGGKGDFVTTAMEDTGTLQSLTFLARAGRVDIDRVLVLRTASNFDQPPPGVTAAENLARTKLGQYSAYLPALESAWRVGNVIVENLIGNWPRYRDVTPAGKGRGK
jgi:purine nucleoside permease